MTRPVHRIALLLSLVLALPAGAEIVELHGPAGRDALDRVEGSATGGVQPTTHTVLVWLAPPVKGRSYSLNGRVEYTGVEGRGYLEMWSHFGSEGSFFSRTLANSGPLRSLRGDSPARAFTLPFDTGDSGLVPDRIELNIVLPGPGSVTVSDLHWSGGDVAGVAPGSWWSQRAAGLLGAVAGACLGMLGALVGVLGGRGRARPAVMTALALCAALGVLALGAGASAVLVAQPAHVSGPLLGIGALALLLSGIGYRSAQRRYEDLEFRRMRAIDLDIGSAAPRG